ncbi:retrovirus-related pol polyprotein from transposon TNT 1-94, partial [Tanacetum coccineum]
KNIKVKKSKNEQKLPRNEETSTRVRFEANIESRIKTVVEKSQESKEKDKGKMTIIPFEEDAKMLTHVTNFQDSPDDEEDTRSSQEYMNDLEEEYQASTLLAKYKRFFKKGTQRFSSAKATNQTECHKCGKKGYFARDCWSKRSVPSYQLPFQSKLLHLSEHKPKLRHTKYFETKYNKVKAKLAFLSSSTSAPSPSSGKNKGLIAESYDWDEEEVSYNKNEVTKVKALMALTDEERIYVGKESARNDE